MYAGLQVQIHFDIYLYIPILIFFLEFLTVLSITMVNDTVFASCINVHLILQNRFVWLVGILKILVIL